MHQSRAGWGIPGPAAESLQIVVGNSAAAIARPRTCPSHPEWPAHLRRFLEKQGCFGSAPGPDFQAAYLFFADSILLGLWLLTVYCTYVYNSPCPNYFFRRKTMSDVTRQERAEGTTVVMERELQPPD